ncbi:unnamed protein product [Ascophyllum nodosum]
MTMSKKVWDTMKERRLLIAAGCFVIYHVAQRKRSPSLPDGDIWLDMDLSRPPLNAKPRMDLSFFTGEPSGIYFKDAVDALEMASSDNRVRGVLGRFSYRSWDKTPLACVQELREAIKKFRESVGEATEGGKSGSERRKFTVAVADTFGEGNSAMGEYFIASSFEKIMMQKTGFVGLTGLGSQQLFFRGLFDKYGVKPEVFAREEYKSFAESLTNKKFSGPNREAVTFLLNGILDHIADGVAQSRGFAGSEAVRAIMNKCPLPAKEALDARLIDGIMYPYDAERMMERLIKKPTLKLEAAAFGDDEVKDRFVVYIAEPKVRRQNASSRESVNTLPLKLPPCPRVTRNRVLHFCLLSSTASGSRHPQYVAVMNLSGTIVRHADSQDGNITSSKLCERLRKISKDKSIGAVVLRIDSGGGSAVASDSIAAAVQRVREAGKPVVCSMGNVAASGGYMIASACDTIVAQPTTITGSIGVVSVKLSIERLLNEWGIEVDSIELTENFLASSPLQELTPKQRSLMDQRVGEIYQDFVSRVADGRKLPVEQILKHAKGRIWTGQQAKERGLVDELGGLNSAITIAKKAAGLPDEALAVVTYPVRPTFKEIFKRLREAGDGTELESFDGMRGIVIAVIEALVGEGTVHSMLAVVKLLASVNDVAGGKAPRAMSERGRGHELELDDLDIF